MMENPRTARPGETVLSVVIPAFNEEATITRVIGAHDAICRSIGVAYEILVMDDGSVDSTAAELERAQGSFASLTVLRHPRNEGIGRSLLQLYRAAAGRWIFFNAADEQVPAGELLKLWAVRSGADLVVGHRSPRRDPWNRVLFAHAYSAVLRALFALQVRDVHSVKLYASESLRRHWPSTESSFAEDEILIALHAAGAVIREIPIQHEPRRSGTAHGGSWRIASRAFLDLLRFALERRARSLQRRGGASSSATEHDPRDAF